MKPERTYTVKKLIFVILAGLIHLQIVQAGQAGKSPVKVFILAGQSNMEGQGKIKIDTNRNKGRGSLEYLVKDPATAKRYKHLINDKGQWVVRDDVWIWYLGRKGGLTVGYGARNDRIGPELQFGHVMGEHFDNQVLLLKTAWGGKSLAKDFRPPGSGGQVGPYYTEMVKLTKDVLANLKEHFPDYDSRGYEIAGFGWHQGWNDGCSMKDTNQYEENLIHFIRDIRREFGNKDVPFVIANSGFGGWKQKIDRRLKIIQAQAAPLKHKEFKGTVACVETRDFFRPPEVSPSRQGYHWNSNAETYFLLGDSMGRAMIRLCTGAAVDDGARLRPVELAEVKIQDDFWQPRIKTNHETGIRHAFEKCDQTGSLANFDKAAGVIDGGHRGTLANDSDVYKVIEGAAYSLQHHPDCELEAYVDKLIDRIIAAQQPDGYLNTYFTVKEPDKRWLNLRMWHELYCAGHYFEAAVAYSQVTGKRKILDSAIKLADYIDSVFGPGKKYDVPGHEEIELALVKLYQATSNERYLNLSKFFLDERGYAHGTQRSPFDPKDTSQYDKLSPLVPARAKHRLIRNGKMQDHKPLIEQTEAVGHAVRAGYVYSAMTDIASITGDEAYTRVVKQLWQDVVSKKLYITGAIGTAQYGDEGFGDGYKLPNQGAYCETCAAVAYILWNYRMNLLTRESRYTDMLELTLYNGFLGGVSHSGDKFFYVNPLASKGKRQRRGWYVPACCPSNVVRLFPQIGRFAYALDNEGIYVNLYMGGACEFDAKGTTVKVLQKTRYPWDGKVLITINPQTDSNFCVSLRIPRWARGRPIPSDLYRFDESSQNKRDWSLNINGKPLQEPTMQKGYAVIERTWKKGDQIELTLPMPVRRVYAHPNIEADRGRVALMRGPLVYCLEELDNKADVLELVLPGDIEFSTEYKDELLGGLVVLHGRTPGAGGSPTEITAVPYYAWNNRSAGKMVVWLPVD